MYLHPPSEIIHNTDYLIQERGGGVSEEVETFGEATNVVSNVSCSFPIL